MSAGHWISLIHTDELEKGDVTPVKIHNRVYAVYDTLTGVTVSDNRCSHAGAPLCDGYFDGRTIECPLHQGLFDAKTGKALAAPVHKPLQMYETRVRDGYVEIYQQPVDLNTK